MGSVDRARPLVMVQGLLAVVTAGTGAEMVPGVGPRRAAAAGPGPEFVRAFAATPDRKRARDRAIAAPPEKERRKAAGEVVGVGA